MKPYPSYKPSGIEWIDEIPAHWVTAQLTHYSRIKTGGTPAKVELEYWDNGTINWMTSGEVNEKYIYHTINKITEKGLQNSNASLLPVGSVMMALSGQGKTKGTVAILRVPSACSQSLAAIISDEFSLHHQYLYFYLESNYKNLRGLVGNDLRDGLNLDIIGQIRVPLPSLPEQQAIAKYLDEKTHKIDVLIEKKQRLIELLKEQRTAIINEAVTKGINPNVKMKDSRIEWFGEIPEHWEVKKLKFIKSSEPNAFVDGPFGSNLKTIHFIENGDVLVVESGFITSGEYIEREFKTISSAHFETIRRSECKAGDIIIAKIGANYGMSGILPVLVKPAVVSGNSLKLTVNSDHHLNKFIQLELLTAKANGALKLIVNETAQPALSLGLLNDLALGVPDLAEQIEIVRFVESELGKIDIAISHAERGIGILQEYRTALISEVVTGKIDVRDYVNGKNN